MNEYVIAKYIRLSRDEAASESMSIPHQRLLLDMHIEELDIPNATVIEFVDNGFTGLNLERPALQEMLGLISSGMVNCIVTKDFSRLFRNEIDSGYYIEQVFPLYSIRFISVSDEFDSVNSSDGTGGMEVAFKFLLNERYSRDLSNKVRSAKRILMQNGEHIVANAIYGYRKNESDKWEPDPEPAEIVRQIFQMALDGLSTPQIRDKLFAVKCLTPKEYANTKRGKSVAPRYMWATKQLHRILVNEQYTGSYVAGKHELKKIGSGARIDKDRTEWIIIPDSHPAIVSKEDFAAVQEMLNNPKESAPDKPVPSSHSKASRPRIASGERKSSAVPYGYVRGDGGEWEVDVIAADVVRGIYEMTIQGLSVREICGKLYESACPTPSEYFKLARGKDIQPTNRWPSLRITEILKDEQYIGTYIAGKSFQDADGKKYRPPKSEWIMIPGKHPPIISKDVFAQIQEIRSKSRRNMRQRDYLLRGVTSCGCCGFALVYGDSTFPATYRCMHTHADPMASCHKMKVNADELESTVMAIIKKQAEVVIGSGDLSQFRKPSDSARQIAERERQIRQYVERRQECYERFVLRKIDKEAYQSQKSDYTAQIERLENQLSLLRQAARDKLANQKAVALANEVMGESLSHKDVVDALIDKIHVFPGNHIEIRWKVADFTAGV